MIGGLGFLSRATRLTRAFISRLASALALIELLLLTVELSTMPYSVPVTNKTPSHTANPFGLFSLFCFSLARSVGI